MNGENKMIGIIGGDMRFVYLAKMLCDDGFEVCVYGQGDKTPDCAVRCVSVDDSMNCCDLIVLPLPFTRDGKNINAPFFDEKIPIAGLTARKSLSPCIASGMLGEYANERGWVDYFDEEMMIKNALPSAEGAIMLALEHMPSTLCKSSAFVIGYGRIGKLLASKLKALGASVTVFARKPADRAYARAILAESADITALRAELPFADVVFNTVPAALLEREDIEAMKPTAVFIELASVACCDSEKIIKAPSLPSRCAPVSAAEYIRDSLYDMIAAGKIKGRRRR